MARKNTYPQNILLGEGEGLLFVTHKHGLFLILSLVPPLLLSLALIAAGLAVAIGLLGPLNWSLLFLFPLFLVFSLLWGVLAYAEWRNDVYLVTEHRIITVRKMFRFWEECQEMELTRIQDITLTVPGPVAAIVDYGHLLITTASSGQALRFASVPHPRQIKAAIFQQRENLLQRQAQDRLQERRAILERELGYGMASDKLPGSRS
ncbi:MAG: PH domain-containing protein [Chloroflexi bacterium]|nr:PH domain-containing protein [Chloroflexota bacterium]